MSVNVIDSPRLTAGFVPFITHPIAGIPRLPYSGLKKVNNKTETYIFRKANSAIAWQA